MIRCRGVTRTVFLVGRWAVKVPRLSSHDDGVGGVFWSLCRGLLANLSERRHSHTSGVCPVLWSLAGVVNVYPRCLPVEHEPTEQEYTDTGYFGPADKKQANVGYLDGRLVFLDYDQEWNDRPPCNHTDGKAAAFRKGVVGPALLALAVLILASNRRTARTAVGPAAS
jgi:hypothetical protein